MIESERKKNKKRIRFFFYGIRTGPRSSLSQHRGLDRWHETIRWRWCDITMTRCYIARQMVVRHASVNKGILDHSKIPKAFIFLAYYCKIIKNISNAWYLFCRTIYLKRLAVTYTGGGGCIPYTIEWLYFHDSVLIAFILNSNQQALCMKYINKSTIHLKWRLQVNPVVIFFKEGMCKSSVR